MHIYKIFYILSCIIGIDLVITKKQIIRLLNDEIFISVMETNSIKDEIMKCQHLKMFGNKNIDF